MLDVEAEQLLLGLIVPSHTSEIPSSINNTSTVHGQGAIAVLG